MGIYMEGTLSTYSTKRLEGLNFLTVAGKMASRLFSTLLLGLSLIDAISAHPSASHRLSVNRGPCFTDHPTFTKDLLKRNPHLGPGKGLEKRLKTEPINLDVWFHVIRKDDSIAGGNIPQERLDAQVFTPPTLKEHCADTL